MPFSTEAVSKDNAEKDVKSRLCVSCMHKCRNRNFWWKLSWNFVKIDFHCHFPICTQDLRSCCAAWIVCVKSRLCVWAASMQKQKEVWPGVVTLLQIHCYCGLVNVKKRILLNMMPFNLHIHFPIFTQDLRNGCAAWIVCVKSRLCVWAAWIVRKEM